MQSKHAVRLFALALLACALPGVALASSSRIEGLGLQGDYVMDYSNVQTYPSAIVRYQNLVYGDLGVKDVSEDGTDGDLDEFVDNNANPRLNNADRSLGLLLGNFWGGRAGAFGVYLQENASPLSPALGAQYFNRNANEAWNLVWGYKFSNLALGLQFNRSFSSHETVDEIDEPSTGSGSSLSFSDDNARQLFNYVASNIGADDWNSLGFGGGVSFDFGEEGHANWVDLSAEVRSYTFEETDLVTGTTFEDDGNLSMAFNARGHLTSGDMHWAPVFNYYRLDLSTDFTDTVDPTNNFTADNTVTGINAGICAQWNVREGDWIYLGAAFQSVDFDFEDFDTERDDDLDGAGELKYTTFPNVFAAMESNLWSWLTLRLGASKPMFSKLEQTDAVFAGEEEFKDSPFQYSLGLGFHLGKVDLDAVMNQDFPFTGGWIASGTQEVPFSRLSATYRW